MRLHTKLRTLSLTVLGAAGLSALPACKEEAPPAAPTVKAWPMKAEVPVPSEEKAQAPQGGGTLRGTITFKGTAPAPTPIEPGADPNCDGMNLVDEPVRVRDGKLANVLVRVRGNVPGQPTTPPGELVVVDQNRCTYLPRVQGAVLGQPIVLMNSDGTLHNVRGHANGKQLFNISQPPLKTREARPPAEAEFIRLACDIHPWMVGWVVVSPHPYFATSNDEGTFTIPGVPPGTYTVEAWHERLGTRTAQVTVKEGEESPFSFEFTAAK